MTKLQTVDSYDRSRVKLRDGTEIEGCSWGIQDAYNNNGDELGYEYVVFKTDKYKNPLSLIESDIISVEEVKR